MLSDTALAAILSRDPHHSSHYRLHSLRLYIRDQSHPFPNSETNSSRKHKINVNWQVTMVAELPSG